MTKGRLEAFSDGVFAVIITIMVLELKAPHGADWPALRQVLPTFLTYVLSYVFLGIYWSNHHHLLHVSDRINGAVLLVSGIAYLILEGRLLRAGNPRLAAAIGNDIKGKVSAVAYLVAIPLAFVHQLIADAIYVSVALMWLVPDRRIERMTGTETTEATESHRETKKRTSASPRA